MFNGNWRLYGKTEIHNCWTAAKEEREKQLTKQITKQTKEFAKKLESGSVTKGDINELITAMKELRCITQASG